MNIKELRTKEGLSQTALAKKLGIATSAIGHMENGRMKVSAKIAAKVKEEFGVEVADAVTAEKIEVKKTAAKAVNALTLTATEKKLVQLYRDADTKTKKAAINLLEGDSNAIELIGALLSANAKGAGSSGSSSGSSGTSDLISALLSGKTGGSSGGAAGKDTMNALMDLLGKINK